MPAESAQCLICGQCAEACPTGARQIIGERRMISEIMAAVLQDRVFYEESGGGVTFSGGEPLAQPEFLKDTCGFACTDVLLDVAGLANLVLYDLKLMDEARHRQYTGVSNGPILANLQALAQAHQNIWLRVPVIPGINDREEDWEAAAGFAAGLQGIRQVNLLPYHKLGLFKPRRRSHPETLENAATPGPEQMERAAEIFRQCGLTVKLGG
jgi:pyruvate formate lyase activating enzyme